MADFKLNNALLEELGLGALPDEQKRLMLQHIYETLELRVGTNLANQMTDQQLDEFEKFIDDGGDQNQAQAQQWLEVNLPNYKQVVNEVFEALKAEIRQMAPQIVASSQQQASQAAPAAPQSFAPTTGQTGFTAPQMSQEPFQAAPPQVPPASAPSQDPYQSTPYPSQQPPAGPGVFPQQ